MKKQVERGELRCPKSDSSSSEKQNLNPVLLDLNLVSIVLGTKLICNKYLLKMVDEISANPSSCVEELTD